MDRPRDAYGAFVALTRGETGGTGPLAGVRVAVKDNIEVAGMPFTAGVPRHAARLAATDAPVVRQLRAAGALLVGVTVTDAGGLGVTTPDVVNPVAPDSIVGGSSGGSAAAVAGGLADAGLGTDTGGSCRIPAACCRLFGFKPTHGRVSSQGVWPLAPDLEDVGVMTRSAELLQSAASVLLDGRKEAGAPRKLTIGVDGTRLARCDDAVVDSFRASLRRLARAGCRIRQVELPTRAASTKAHSTLALANALAIYDDALRQGDEAGLGKTIWRALDAARNVTTEDVRNALALREELARTWDAAMRDVDCIATPTLPVPVPARGTRRVTLHGVEISVVAALTAETSIANLFGAPAVAIPPPHESASLQLIAAAGRDEALLAHAARIHGMLGAN